MISIMGVMVVGARSCARGERGVMLMGGGGEREVMLMGAGRCAGGERGLTLISGGHCEGAATSGDR